MSDDSPRFRFGPRSTRGLIAGWRGGQVAAVAVGALLAVGLLRSVGGLAGVTLALAAVSLGIGVATVPLGGRPAESWVPTVAGHAATVLSDGRDLPWLPAAARRRRTGALAQLRLVTPPEPSDLGVVEDGRCGTWSAAIPVGSQGYALLDDAGRAAAVAAWAGVLSAMAADGHGLHRLQWIARTRPARDRDLVPPPGRDGPATSYRALCDEVMPELWERDALVVVTVKLPRRSREPRRRPSPGSAAGERLSLLLSSLGDRLATAGLVAGTPLRPSELASVVRRAYATDSAELRSPWPVGVEARWRALRTDESWQATYWVAEWPRGEVGPGVLLPLLVGAHQRRTVSLTMAPLPPGSAVRRAERERTAGAADADLRRRHGFALTARARAEQDVRLQREAELAEGHAAYLFSGYVAVTADDEEALERDCLEAEQAAALAQLELRRLFGAQEQGWCCTLPSGRGCG